MFVLREKLEDKADDAKSGGSADDKPTVQPGPGETEDSIVSAGLRAATVDKKPDEGDDKGDEVKDDDAKAAKDDDKKDDAKAAKDDDKKDDKDAEIKGIPKSRLDAALARTRAAEKELREVRAKQAAEPATTSAKDDDEDTLTIAQAETRVSDLDVEIAKAMKDEEDETGAKLAVLLREQRELSEGIQEAKLEDFQTDSRALTSEEIQFDRVVDELESQIPQLDPDHDDYDEDLVSETITLAQALNGQGRTQADSMLLAVDYMSGRLGITKDVVADVKKGTDIEKNVKLAAKLPPDLTDAKGVASDKAGVTKESGKISDMSTDEFNALTDDEDRLKFLRGDTL